MSAARRLGRNVASLGLAQGATLVLGFVLWIHLGRALGAERLGMIAFGTALLSYFLLGVTLGFDAVAVRETARDGTRETTLVPTLLSLRIALAAAMTATFAGVVLALRLEPIYQLAVLVLGSQLFARAIQLDWIYQAREQMGTAALRNAGQAAVTAGVALVFVRGPDDVVWAAAAVAAGPIVANLVLLGVYVREAGVPRLRIDRAEWVALLVPAIPLAAAALTTQIYYSADKLMLEALRDTVDVGLYEAAYKGYALGIAVAGVLYLAFFPVLSGTLGNREAMRESGARFASALAMVGPPFALGGAVYAPEILSLLFGTEYLPATTALRVLLVYAALVHVSMSFGVPLLAWDAEKDYLRAVLMGGIANVVLNLALVAPLGPTGAAVATLTSEAVVTVGVAIRYRRLTGTLMPTVALRGGVVAVGGGLIPAAVASSLDVSIFLTVPLVAVTTGLTGWAIGLTDLRALTAILLRRGT